MGTESPDRNTKPLFRLSSGYVEWAIADPALGSWVISENSANIILSEGTDGGIVALCTVVLWVREVWCCQYIAQSKGTGKKASFYCLNLVMYLLEGVSDTCKIPCQSIFLPIYSPKHFLSWNFNTESANLTWRAWKLRLLHWASWKKLYFGLYLWKDEFCIWLFYHLLNWSVSSHFNNSVIVEVLGA